MQLRSKDLWRSFYFETQNSLGGVEELGSADRIQHYETTTTWEIDMLTECRASAEANFLSQKTQAKWPWLLLCASIALLLEDFFVPCVTRVMQIGQHVVVEFGPSGGCAELIC